ncbi:GNAT family N-acetyltransferase [Paenibacillus periandrae]|uniref:GNAT family N-acetyltransferase n=1 Tax=Paenibacillus periandrae TaxID=1761741 RepID=UPI001F098373|nr:GNAT family N-acetyltransferase [Paenibacillus periandrae]
MSLLEIIMLTSETADPYLPFTYRTYRDWMIKPETDKQVKLMAFGACFLGKPVGLLLVHPPVLDEPARVLSVYVDERFRRLGIATALMQELKACLRRKNWKPVFVEYYALNKYEGFERLLLKSGWQTPAVYSRFYRCDILTGRESPWIHRFKLPAGYRVIPWSELKRDELAEMNLLQEAGFNAYYMPLHQEGIIERSCSLVLKLDEEIVGWSIIDRELADTLLYRVLYIREEFRDHGLGPALAAQSAQRVSRTDASHLVIQILESNVRMRKIADRLLIPMRPVVTEYKTAVIEL